MAQLPAKRSSGIYSVPNTPQSKSKMKISMKRKAEASPSGSSKRQKAAPGRPKASQAPPPKAAKIVPSPPARAGVEHTDGYLQVAGTVAPRYYWMYTRADKSYALDHIRGANKKTKKYSKAFIDEVGKAFDALQARELLLTDHEQKVVGKADVGKRFNVVEKAGELKKGDFFGSRLLSFEKGCVEALPPMEKPPAPPAPPAPVERPATPPPVRSKLATTILGPYIDAPTVRELLDYEPEMEEFRLRDLRSILDAKPRARHDLNVVLESLRARWSLACLVHALLGNS